MAPPGGLTLSGGSAWCPSARRCARCLCRWRRTGRTSRGWSWCCGRNGGRDARQSNLGAICGPLGFFFFNMVHVKLKKPLYPTRQKVFPCSKPALQRWNSVVGFICCRCHIVFTVTKKGKIIAAWTEEITKTKIWQAAQWQPISSIVCVWGFFFVVSVFWKDNYNVPVCNAARLIAVVKRHNTMYSVLNGSEQGARAGSGFREGGSEWKEEKLQSSSHSVAW